MLAGVGALAGRARQEDKPAEAAPPEMAARSLAVVDMEKLYTAAGGPQVLQQRAQEIGADIDQRLNAIALAPYLNQAERTEYIGLIEKFKPTETEQARMNALKTLSEQRAVELQTLQVKKPLAPADNTRLNELIGEKRALDQSVPAIQEVARAQQDERLAMFRRDQLAQLRATVGEVAKQKGIANVFDVNALVYSANDLTPLVLQRLSKQTAHTGKHTGE
jgi:Skp family chaperone for outer membrane proteins